MGRWQRYWFADGGRTAAASVRVAIASSVLVTLARLDNPVSTGDLPGSRALYRPVGIWMLLGHHAPPGWLVELLWVVAWAGTVAMLLGLATRAATAVSFVAGVALAALSFSSSRLWSHQYNVVFLAQLAFLGARGGDVASLDWLIRRVRKLPPLDVARGYQWSLRLVQLAVALMFAGAAFHKLAHGHFTLRWAFSDNLRHHLLVRFDLAGLARPPLVDWLIDDPWRYRTAALLNMISQAAPLAACFLLRRPWLRALAGSFFVIETIALGLIVDLWNLHWLPLAAVFVDWDRLIAWLARRPRTVQVAPPDWTPPRGIRIFIVAFLVYDLLTAFIPTLDQRLNTFPFSSFPMFSTVRARPPYAEHQPYGVAGDSFEVTSDAPIDAPTQRWFDHANRGLYAVRDPVDLERRLRTVLAQAQRRYPSFGIRGVRLWLAIYEAPAYPVRAHFECHPIAVVGEIAADGKFRSVLGKLHGKPGSPQLSLELGAKNVDVVHPMLVYYRDDLATPIQIEGTLSGSTYELGAQRIAGNPLYFVVLEVGGLAWLVASYSTWVWN